MLDQIDVNRAVAAESERDRGLVAFRNEARNSRDELAVIHQRPMFNRRQLIASSSQAAAS